MFLSTAQEKEKTAATPAYFKHRGFAFVSQKLGDAYLKMLIKHGNILKAHVIKHLHNVWHVVRKWQGFGDLHGMSVGSPILHVTLFGAHVTLFWF
jgi:hypothetical protein